MVKVAAILTLYLTSIATPFVSAFATSKMICANKSSSGGAPLAISH
jgi:hypothetical protein